MVKVAPSPFVPVSAFCAVFASGSGCGIGHAVGGVCPFAVNEGVEVYLDESLKRFQTVFPACGSANSAIEVTLPELEKFSASADWVDVCKEWRNAPSV